MHTDGVIFFATAAKFSMLRNNCKIAYNKFAIYD